jgi:ABC-type phosphate/phosphonate transport system substrate-binding protein
MVELNPQLNEQLTMLASSPALIHSIVCLSRNSDEEVKKAILDTAFKLGNDTAGKQILTLFQMDRVALYKQSYLEAMTALAREHHDLATRLANRR